MTQPEPAPLYDTPPANAARQAAITVYTQYEPLLYQGYLAMMNTWLDAVRQATLGGGVKALALMPNPYSVFTQTPTWNRLIEQYNTRTLTAVLNTAYRHVLGDGHTFTTEPFIHNQIAQAVNQMRNTPNEVFGIIKTIIDNAVKMGASIPDITAQVEQALSATGTDTWKHRAETVAKTQVHTAYTGGTHHAFTMITEADPDTAWVHRWLSTEDERTRPTHRAADGQVQPASLPFQVGGFAMMYPGDPLGPPQEVINCRCVELLEEADDPTSMVNKGMKS